MSRLLLSSLPSRQFPHAILFVCFAIFVLIFSSPSAQAHIGEWYPVKDKIVVTTFMLGGDGSKQSGSMAELVKQLPAFAPENVKSVAVNLIRETTSKEVRENVSVVAPTTPSEWPLTEETLYLTIEYNIRYLKVGKNAELFLSLMLRPQFPLFDSVACFNCAQFWKSTYTRPLIILPINIENPGETLERALRAAMSGLTNNLCLSSPSHSAQNCKKDNE